MVESRDDYRPRGDDRERTSATSGTIFRSSRIARPLGPRPPGGEAARERSARPCPRVPPPPSRSPPERAPRASASRAAAAAGRGGLFAVVAWLPPSSFVSAIVTSSRISSSRPGAGRGCLPASGRRHGLLNAISSLLLPRRTCCDRSGGCSRRRRRTEGNHTASTRCRTRRRGSRRSTLPSPTKTTAHWHTLPSAQCRSPRRPHESSNFRWRFYSRQRS